MNPLTRAVLWLLYYASLAPLAIAARWFDPLELRSHGWRKPED